MGRKALYTTPEEKAEKRRETCRRYYEKNKEKLKTNSKEYYNKKKVKTIKVECNKHTKNQPSCYVSWHEWASKMSETKKQIKCSGCGLYEIWVKK